MGEPAAPAKPTFGGVDAELVTEEMLRRFWRLRMLNLIGLTVSMLFVATVPIVIASAFAHREIGDFFGDEVYVALAALVLLTLIIFVAELVRMGRYRSLDAFRRGLPIRRPELTSFQASVLNEIEIVLVRGALPAITAASLFVTVLRLASADSAFEQQSLFKYYAFAYFALFGMLLLSLAARRAYLGVAARRTVVSA